MKARLVIVFVAAVCSCALCTGHTESPAQRSMAIVGAYMRIYKDAHGEFPVGKNWQVVRALDPKAHGGKILPDSRRDAEGNILDPYGFPYIFLQSSEGDAVIVSVGEANTTGDPRKIEFHAVDLKGLNLPEIGEVPAPEIDAGP